MARQLDLFQPPPPVPDGDRGAAAAPSAAAADAAAADGRAAADAAVAGVTAAAAGTPAGVVACRGSLAAEALLLAALDDLAAAARRDPSRLALPVRVVVPSRSLRRHVAARLVRSRSTPPGGGGAMAGVMVQTLFGLACEVLERAGAPAPGGSLLFATLVEREARREDALRRGLGDLVDGFLSVTPAVTDLLDAGLEAAHAEAVDEALASDGPRSAGRAAVARARALVRVAVRAELALRELGLGRRPGLLRQAAEALRTAPAPERLLPSRALLLHGFVAASGLAGDLLEVLLRQHGATLLLDLPPVPGVAAATETAAVARLAERAAAAASLAPAATGESAGTWALAAAAGGVAAAEADPIAAPGAVGAPGAVPVGGVPRLEAFTAAGADAEAREVARRLRRLLDGEGPATAAMAGEAGPADAVLASARRIWPEGLAIVARDLAPYRAALRRHLSRLGVPFSGVGEPGGLLPAGRRAGAALELLRRGPEALADRWLDASAWMADELRVDLRLAMGALGAARLRDVAALREQRFDGGVALPIRHGLRPAGLPAVPPAGGEPPPPDDDGEGRAVAKLRRISEGKLRRGVAAAVRVHDRLAAWPPAATASVQLEWLRGLLGDLGLDGDPALPLAAAAVELQREVPADLALGRDELRLLLERAMGDGGRCPIGGEGGGVQVLSVAEARGRTFDQLFLLGLNRAVFPRPRREDPLLPDDLRQVVQRLLPDLGLARDGGDDERHAFAQLLSAAPVVCLSWQTADDDGKPLSASPLVERLLADLESPPVAPAIYPTRPPVPAGGTLAAVAGMAVPGGKGGAADPRPADEHAALAALHGSRQDLARVLPLAVRQVREELGRELFDLDPQAVAAARFRILEEQDPDELTPAGRAAVARLGPYLGFAGPAAARGPHQLFVTHLEGLAACPWQLFLGRLLRIEPPPDPLDALPGGDPLRLGIVVHRSLDRIVKRALGASPPAAPPFAPPPLASPELASSTPAPPAPAPPAPAPLVFVPAPLASPAPASPVAVPWPAAEEVEPLLVEVAAEVLAEEGLALPGLARALAVQALPLVTAAGETDWRVPGAVLPVLASEVDGELLLHGRRLRFRADRLDLVDGRQRFTDYKTGRHFSAARDAGKRRRQLLADIGAGKRLQAVAYLLAAGEPGAIGRYLFLRPDLAPEVREAAVETGDAEATGAFGAAVATLLGAWDAGSFFPRLLDAAGHREP
ncbi:MAG TPA: PD-(D/E)XK nuclease family protein, partial [Thermoanaerobaculia bacterium]|nr:PD-(D/E)XK nuclease family protein [Thermoanaerobaculia bacterium]